MHHLVQDRSIPPTSQGRLCWLYHCGVLPYHQVWMWQKQLVSDRHRDPHLPDVVLFVEHPPVYTLGQGATTDFLKFAPQHSDYEVHRIERGGEVTYHCPGQLVIYPILNLRYYRQDLHWYLRQLEEVVICTLADFGLHGDRISGLTGVWLNGHKVAALGIKVSRWITMHGLSLNVCPDLSGFKRIVPCGLSDRPVGSLAEFRPDISPLTVHQRMTAHFAQIFQVEFVEIQPSIR